MERPQADGWRGLSGAHVIALGEVVVAVEERKRLVTPPVVALEPDEDALVGGSTQFHAEPALASRISKSERGEGSDGGMMRIE